jgi:hypothetical protein
MGDELVVASMLQRGQEDTVNTEYSQWNRLMF